MRFIVGSFFLLIACKAPASLLCQHTPNSNPYQASIPDSEIASAAGLAPLPPDFAFGVATAPYQIESGNHTSDWYLWEQLGKIKNNDHADDGPQAQAHVDEDIALLQSMHLNAYRLGLEWGRLFPTRAAFDALTPDPVAFAYYRGLLEKLHAAGIAPMVTLQHFTLPIWLQAPPDPTLLGLADPALPELLARYASWAGGAFGDLVDEWITINEPLGEIAGGYADGSFPPGHIIDLDGFKAVFRNLVYAHARAYDALRAADRFDADGDGVPALISFASHDRAWVPENPGVAADLAGARRVRYVSHLAFLDAVVCGNTDFDFSEKWSATADPDLMNRVDFIALNYYSIAAVQGIPIEPYLGVPLLSDLQTDRPKDDVGWDISPEGLRAVVNELKPYRLPIIITENGVADAADSRRAKQITQTLAQVQQLRGEGVDIRGYYHWSLIDNFEWAMGFCPHFGLATYDAQKRRQLRASGTLYGQIAADRTVTNAELEQTRYGVGRLHCEN